MKMLSGDVRPIHVNVLFVAWDYHVSFYFSLILETPGLAGQAGPWKFTYPPDRDQVLVDLENHQLDPHAV